MYDSQMFRYTYTSLNRPTTLYEYNLVDDYFDSGVLKSRFNGKTVIFAENFENLGKLTINAENVTIKGMGYSLKNCVFNLEAKNITLSDLNIDLDSEFANNDYAGVFDFLPSPKFEYAKTFSSVFP